MFPRSGPIFRAAAMCQTMCLYHQWHEKLRVEAYIDITMGSWNYIGIIMGLYIYIITIIIIVIIIVIIIINAY